MARLALPANSRRLALHLAMLGLTLLGPAGAARCAVAGEPPPAVIQLRIAVPVERVRAEVEKRVPNEVKVSEKGDWAGDLAADEEFYVTVKRGRLNLRFPDPGKILLSTAWKADPKWSGKVLFVRTTVGSHDCSGTVSAKMEFDIDPHTWRPRVRKLDLDGQVERCFVKGPAGIGNIDLKKALSGPFSKAIEQGEADLQKKLNDMMPGLKTRATRELAVLQRGIAIAQKPKTWLRFVPTAARYEAFAQNDDRLEMVAGLVGKVEVVVAESPPDAWNTLVALPDLERKKIDDPSFTIRWTTTTDWKTLESIVTRMSPIRIPLDRLGLQAPAGEDGRQASLEIGAIKSITGDGAGHIRIGLRQVTCPIGLDQPTDINVRFAPRWNRKENSLAVADVQIEPKTGDPVTRALSASVAFLLNQKKVRVALQSPLKKLKKQAEIELSKLREKSQLQIGLDAITIESLECGESGISVSSTVAGSAIWMPSAE